VGSSRTFPTNRPAPAALEGSERHAQQAAENQRYQQSERACVRQLTAKGTATKLTASIARTVSNNSTSATAGGGCPCQGIAGCIYPALSGGSLCRNCVNWYPNDSRI
jgi:hypothetical protein